RRAFQCISPSFHFASKSVRRFVSHWKQPKPISPNAILLHRFITMGTAPQFGDSSLYIGATQHRSSLNNSALPSDSISDARFVCFVGTPAPQNQAGMIGT